MKRLPLPLLLTLVVSSAGAKERPTIHYTPPAGDERPTVVDGIVGHQGSDFALRLSFNKPPVGPECGSRCASVTLLLDTDASTSSGLKLSDKEAENGADLALIIQGTRDLASSSGESFLRVRVRRLTRESHTVEAGELVADLDHRKEPERIYIDGNTVFLLIDGGADLPAGRKMRVIYHPPGSKAIQGLATGMEGGGDSRGLMIFRQGNWGKAQEGGTRVGPSSR